MSICRYTFRDSIIIGGFVKIVCRVHGWMHIRQSWVEIKHYSVAYFDCVTVFEAL